MVNQNDFLFPVTFICFFSAKILKAYKIYKGYGIGGLRIGKTETGNRVTKACPRCPVSAGIKVYCDIAYKKVFMGYL